jgi:hypothetical protein
MVNNPDGRVLGLYDGEKHAANQYSCHSYIHGITDV